jgi:hypothetical protein
MIGLLQVLGTAVVIVMAMRENEILHLRRIEAELFIAANYDLLSLLGVIQTVDLNDAGLVTRAHDATMSVPK